MNYKHIAIIALVLMLALVVPASAVWSNGNWVADDKKDEYFGNAEVKYDPTTGVTSKYSAPADVDLMTYQGMVIGHLRSGAVLGGGERFLIHRVGTPDNETLVQYFQPDGKYTGYLAPGEYDVILPQGTGSACGIYSDEWGYVGNPHEERAKINVVVGQISYFDFIGNSIPSYSSDVPVVVDSCKDIKVTAGNIHQHRHPWWGTYYAFDLTVKGTNANKFQIAPVEVTDSDGHTLFDFFVVAIGTNQYTIGIPVDGFHASHNPLTVNTGDTTCKESCHGYRCHNEVNGAYYDHGGFHNN